MHKIGTDSVYPDSLSGYRRKGNWNRLCVVIRIGTWKGKFGCPTKTV